MRILLVNDWGFPRGGAESYLFSLASALRAQNHTVITLSSDRTIAGEDFSTDIQVKHSGHCFNLDSYFNPINFVQLNKIVRFVRPDIVHFHNVFYTLSPSVLFAIGKASSVLTLHDYFAICARDKRLVDGSVCANRFGKGSCNTGCGRERNFYRLSIRRSIARAGLKRMNQLIAPSEFVINEFRRNGIHNVTLLKHPATVSILESKSSAGYLLYLGRLAEQKGVEPLLLAFSDLLSEYPQAKLKIAGSGPAEPRLRAVVEECRLQNSVEFLGYLSAEAREQVLSRAAALVAPSLWPEVACLSLYEAAALGKPAIASRVGAIPEFVADQETGLLFEPGDHQSMIAVLRRALADPDALSRMGSKAKENAQQYSMAKHVEGLFRIYYDATSS